jgi:hypothetical protein
MTEWWFVLSVLVNVLLFIALINKHKEYKIIAKKFGTISKAANILADETK